MVDARVHEHVQLGLDPEREPDPGQAGGVLAAGALAVGMEPAAAVDVELGHEHVPSVLDLAVGLGHVASALDPVEPTIFTIIFRSEILPYHSNKELTFAINIVPDTAAVVEVADGIEEAVVDIAAEELPELPVVERLNHIALLLKNLVILSGKSPFFKSSICLNNGKFSIRSVCFGQNASTAPAKYE